MFRPDPKQFREDDFLAVVKPSSLSRGRLIELQIKASREFARPSNARLLTPFMEGLEEWAAAATQDLKSDFEALARGVSVCELRLPVDHLLEKSLQGQLHGDMAAIAALALLPVIRKSLGLKPVPQTGREEPTPRATAFRSNYTSIWHEVRTGKPAYIPASCVVCADFQGTLDMYFPVAMYQYAARQFSCRPCEMLLEAIELFMPGWTAGNTSFDHFVQIMAFRRTSWRAIMLKRDEANVGEFKVLRPPGDPENWGITSFEIRPDIVHDTASEAGPARVKKWLTACVNGHKNCKIRDPVFVPTRLIYVGRKGSVIDPFLVSRDEPCSYAALSYCWGADLKGVIRTTKGNLDSHRKGITFSDLPRTLQDAVVFCRGMGIEYLWVDALCIVQDDSDDWFREASLMHQVYSNSLLTIAADVTDSCRLGFLGKQKYGASGDEQRGWHVGPRDEFLNVVSRDVPDPERPGETTTVNVNEPSPLFKRGWCTQESVLPIRKIRFTAEEMIWVCNEGIMCECGHWEWDRSEHDEADHPWYEERHKPAFYHLKTDFVPKLDYLSRQGWSPYEDWRYMITHYSKTRLTKPTDKLSAVSGLAQMVQAATRHTLGTPDKYLAGLWAHDLARGLTWRIRGQKNGHGIHNYIEELGYTRPTEYRAPSWSWAALDGPITWEFDDSIDLGADYKLQAEFRLSESYCSVMSPLDPTGPVTAGFLVVTGDFAPVNAAALAQDYGLSLDEPQEPSDSEQYLLRVCTLTTPERWMHSEEKYEFFLLVRNSSTVAGAYERVGLYVACGKDSVFRDSRVTTVKLV